MTQQRLTIETARKADLRKRVLEYFGQEEAQRSSNLDKLEQFEGFDKQEIRLMIYGLDAAGLIRIVNGRMTSGAMYGLTPLGRIVLQIESYSRKLGSI
jgi:hypothetical protein